MKGRLHCSTVLVALLSSTSVGAQPASPPRGQGYPRVAPVLPTLTLSGDTSGKAKIEAGADIITGLGAMWDISVAPALSLSSADGVAAVFSFDGDKPVTWNPSWRAKVTVSLLNLGLDDSHEATLGGPQRQRRIRAMAYAGCIAACADSLDPDRDKAFCDGLDQVQQQRALKHVLDGCLDGLPQADECQSVALVLERVKQDFQRRSAELGIRCPNDQTKCAPLIREIVSDVSERFPRTCSEQDPVCKWLAKRAKMPDVAVEPASYQDNGNLCAMGKQLVLEQYDKPTRDDRGQFPKWTISAGVSYGANAFKYLEGDGAMSPTYTVSTSTKSSYTLGASLTYVQPTGGSLTFELPFLFDSAWSPSGTTAKWCTAIGQVKRDAPATGIDEATSCDEQPVGGPTHQSELWAAALLGRVDKPKGLWRLSAGPTFAYRFDGAHKGQYRLGIQAPIYVNFANLDEKYTGKYKLLLRIVPEATLVHDETGLRPKGGVTVQLLGARNLFGRALDWP